MALASRWRSATTDTLIVMAVAMTLARALGLAVRANHIRGHVLIAPITA